MSKVTINVGEAGKRNSAGDQTKLQQLHDTAVELGADCGEPDADDAKESRRLPPWLRFTEAGLKQADSADAHRQAVSKAVNKAYEGSRNYAYTRDIFPKHVVVQHGDKMFAHPMTKDAAGGVSLGDPMEVESTYSPLKASDYLESAIGSMRLFPVPFGVLERNFDKNVGGGVDRDKLTDADFAGKNRSFPIVTAADVKDALESIGRAKNNYSPAELKSRILAIAKRKGFPIPAADQKEAAAAAAADGLVRLEEAAVDLVEGAMRADGTAHIKIIAPGWGSSGYYPADVLERDGPKVFTKGLHMYLDHPTPTEESERPERSVKDLAATLTNNARWMENGKAGPGLYADAEVHTPFRPFIEEVAGKIGVSIRAAGRAEAGQAEGRKGPIIKSLATAESIDFVTRAGAGGKILQLYEAARSRQTQPTGATQMDEKELTQLRETAADAERLRDVVILREAKDHTIAKLAKVDGLPDMVKTRLTERLSLNPPVAGAGRERKLDAAALDTRITEGVKEELTYLAGLGIGDGKVRGMGSAAVAEGDSAKPEELQKQLNENFKRIGVPDKIATIAATGRAA